MRIPKWSQQAFAWPFAENSRQDYLLITEPRIQKLIYERSSCFEILKPAPRKAHIISALSLLGAIPSIIDNHSNHHFINCRTCMGILRVRRREYHLKTLVKTRTEKFIMDSLILTCTGNPKRKQSAQFTLFASTNDPLFKWEHRCKLSSFCQRKAWQF